ncbi:MAG: hypothetical protein K6B68_11565, partial [Eubacterium sp.]|nr:hypothetical protein [Eubacterium sp.]
MKKINIRKYFIVFISASILAGSLTGCGKVAREEPDNTSTENKNAVIESDVDEEQKDVRNYDENELTESEIKVGDYNNKLMLHDPQLFVANEGGYYMYGSHSTGAKGNSLTL